MRRISSWLRVVTGKGPEYVLSDAEIKTRKTDGRDLVELMEEWE